MKNPYIIPSLIIAAAILAGFWMLKSPSEPQKVIVVKPPDISIHKAARYGNIEAVKQHLTAGTDVNAKNDWGWTPLHFAARNGHKEIVELLIAEGADVNAKDEDGRTPLDVAMVGDIKHKRTEIANLLRKHGGKTREELKAEGN